MEILSKFEKLKKICVSRERQGVVRQLAAVGQLIKAKY